MVTRRQLFHLLGAAGVLLRCGPSSGPTGVFSDDERSALGALANAVIPPDDDPGGEALGAIDYIERLITAFDAHVPAIFAGGPFSGRQPDGQGNVPQNDFTNFIELDRVSEFAWKLKILGGPAPNDAILGPVVGLRDQVKQGLAAAMSSSPTPLAQLAPADLTDVFNRLDTSFRDLMIDLVTQAAFCAPEYGGNKDLAGWQLCHFEGDSQPLGYSQWDGKNHVERPDAPLSTANPGPDPAPMDAQTNQVLNAAVTFLGGRVNG
jgi:hypothetical protein